MIKHPHRLALATLVVALAGSSMAAHAGLLGGGAGGAFGGGIGQVGGSLGGAFGGQGQWQAASPRPAVHAAQEGAQSRTNQAADQAMQRKDHAAAAASGKASRAEGVAVQGLHQAGDVKGEGTASTAASGQADAPATRGNDPTAGAQAGGSASVQR